MSVEQVDVPNRTGSNTGWGLWGGRATSKIQAVSTNDGDHSVVYAASGGRLVIDTYRFPTIEGVADPVAGCSITAKTKRHLQGAGGQAYYMRYNNQRSGSNGWLQVRWAGGYTNVGYSASGNELALSAVNGQHGMEFSAAGGPSNKAEVWVTYLTRTVTFDYSAGGSSGYARYIGLLAAAIGGNLSLRDISRISRELWRLRGVRILPDGYEKALRAWNAQKHMVMV